MRGTGQSRRLQYTISILRVHVARQWGATDSAVMDESIQKRGPIIAETGSLWPDVRGASRFGVRSLGYRLIPIQEDTAYDFKDP